MRHPKSWAKLDALKPGDVIQASDGPSAVLAVGPRHPDGEGSYAHAVIMRTRAVAHDPFVVTQAYWQDDAPEPRWQFYSGDYCASLYTATAAFRRRTNQDA